MMRLIGSSAFTGTADCFANGSSFAHISGEHIADFNVTLNNVVCLVGEQSHSL